MSEAVPARAGSPAGLANVTEATSAHASANTSVRRAIPVLLPLSGAPVCAPWFFPETPTFSRCDGCRCWCRRCASERMAPSRPPRGSVVRWGWSSGRRTESAGGAVVVGARLPELLVSLYVARFGLVWTRVGRWQRREVPLRIIRIFRAPISAPYHTRGSPATACASTPTPSMRPSNTASANPYFAQLWGEALSKRRLACESAGKVTQVGVQGPPSRLSADHARAARPAVGALVTDYYEDRYLELDQSGRL